MFVGINLTAKTTSVAHPAVLKTPLLHMQSLSENTIRHYGIFWKCKYVVGDFEYHGHDLVQVEWVPMGVNKKSLLLMIKNTRITSHTHHKNHANTRYAHEKTNMEHENALLEKEIPFGNHHF